MIQYKNPTVPHPLPQILLSSFSCPCAQLCVFDSLGQPQMARGRKHISIHKVCFGAGARTLYNFRGLPCLAREMPLLVWCACCLPSPCTPTHKGLQVWSVFSKWWWKICYCFHLGSLSVWLERFCFSNHGIGQGWCNCNIWRWWSHRTSWFYNVIHQTITERVFWDFGAVWWQRQKRRSCQRLMAP